MAHKTELEQKNLGLLPRMSRPLTLFGLFAVIAQLVCYALEARSAWFLPGFAATCLLGSVYGFLEDTWPFGVVEVVWAGVALVRWRRARTGSPIDHRGGEGAAHS